MIALESRTQVESRLKSRKKLLKSLSNLTLSTIIAVKQITYWPIELNCRIMRKVFETRLLRTIVIKTCLIDQQFNFWRGDTRKLSRMDASGESWEKFREVLNCFLNYLCSERIFLVEWFSLGVRGLIYSIGSREREGMLSQRTRSTAKLAQSEVHCTLCKFT